VTKKLIVPCVHMNGTGEKSLLEEIENAYHALDAAYDALRKTAPNGRDYYVYPGGAYERARNEHRDRLLAVDSVKKELTALALAISDREEEATVEE
jgi:hypothetical protein